MTAQEAVPTADAQQSQIPKRIIGVGNAHKFVKGKGVKLTRQGFYHSHIERLAEAGIAKEVAPRFWEFDGPKLSKWAEYILEVQRRRATGELPNNYSLNLVDYHLFHRGAW